jgi:hypothetical protein
LFLALNLAFVSNEINNTCSCVMICTFLQNIQWFAIMFHMVLLISTSEQFCTIT